MDKDKLSKEVRDAVRYLKYSKKQDSEESKPKEGKRNPHPRTPKLQQEQLPQKVRDAFQFLRYNDHLSARDIITACQMNKNSTFVYKLENGESVSTDTVLKVIKVVWDCNSLGELIKKADDLKEQNVTKKDSPETGKWTGIVSDSPGKSGNRRGA